MIKHTTSEMYNTIRPKKSNLKIIIFISVIIVFILIISFILFKKNNPQYEFTTIKATKGDITSIVSAAGTISATNEVLIGSQVSGRISAVFVEENDVVKKGDVLAIIDPETINQNIAKNEAMLNSARANLEASIVNYTNKKRNYDRLNQVYKMTKGKSPSLSDLDNAYNDMTSSQATVNVNKAKVVEVETGLKSAKIDLKNSIITSPIEGVVLKRTIDAGQTVAASFSTPELFVIAENLDHMKLVVNVSEADVGNVLEKQNVNFTVDTFPDEVFKSTIHRVNKGSSATEENIVSYETTIYVNNIEGKLRSGMSATANIETASASNVMTIPISATYYEPPVIKKLSESEKRPKFLQGPPSARFSNMQKGVRKELDRQNATVYVLENGTPVMKKINVGISDGRNIEVLSGLTFEDNVITYHKMK